MLNHEAGKTLKQKTPAWYGRNETLATRAGLSLHYIDNSVRRGALAVAVPGVYYRDEARPTWQGVVASLCSKWLSFLFMSVG